MPPKRKKKQNGPDGNPLQKYMYKQSSKNSNTLLVDTRSVGKDSLGCVVVVRLVSTLVGPHH